MGVSEIELKEKLIKEAKEKEAKEKAFLEEVEKTANALKVNLGLPKIHVVTTSDEVRNYVVYLKPITRHAFIELSMNAENQIDYANILLNLLAIKEHGDLNEVLERDDLFLSVMGSVIETMTVKKSNLKTY